MSVIDGRLSTLGVTARLPELRGGSVAVALAIQAMQGELPIDFLHTRLAPPKEHRIDRRIVWAVAGAVLLALLIVAALMDLHKQQAVLTALQTTETNNAERVKAAQAFVSRVDYAKGWRTDRPRFVACLRDLTNLMPDDGRTFVTSFTLHDTRKGVLTGKSSSGASVLTLVQKLNANKLFDNVELLDEREQNGETSFSIAFSYDPTGQHQPAADAKAPNRGQPARPITK
jgi:type IV pilus assembly PilN-like protein